MLGQIKRSISNKLMLVVLSTTFLSLLTYGTVMLLYDLRSYHDALAKDLATQANIIAEISTPALQFNDPLTAQENLELLRTRPAILRAAIYTANGERFAQYTSTVEQAVQWPDMPLMVGGHVIEGDRITVWRRIVKDRKILGTVYIRARYEAGDRLLSYAFILACVMAASLGVAALVTVWLRKAFTKPIFAVTHVAHEVMQSRDFSLRAEKFTQDEIGILVDAFNNMLGEVERRAKALEQSNQSLEHAVVEREAAERALLLADKRKDEFLATLAHELRNPLAPLLNGLQIMRTAGDDAQAQAKALEVMERQLRQMVRLVDDLLDVSRITTGKLTIDKQRVTVQSVMQAAVESSFGFIETCGHTLVTRMPPDPVYLDADPVRLAQVFSNLLNNAAKYTNRGGSITFSAEQAQGELLVEVTDNGIGIAADMLQAIFDMFIQVDYSLERSQAGLGVGLALSKRLVELHGGTLKAFSGGAGKGSTFRVTLTIVDSLDVEGDGTPTTEGADKSCCRVLLVDDNVDFVSTMATLLAGLGHQVQTAHDGPSAIALAHEFAPDYAFLDIGMPGLNGYDLARRLREMPETRECVLVAVTGWGQAKDRQMSAEAGFDNHLVKPVELSQILEILTPDRST